jgi:hypothetical protein
MGWSTPFFCNHPFRLPLESGSLIFTIQKRVGLSHQMAPRRETANYPASFS